jgi:ribose transport system permease protein
MCASAMLKFSRSAAQPAQTIEEILNTPGRTFASRLFASQEFWITIAVLATGLIVAQIAPRFGSTANLSNVLQNSCFIGILALGMTPVIVSGGIDISIGSVLGLCGVTFGLLLHSNLPLSAGIALTLLLGAAIGGLNGFLIAYLRLPPFIVTLGMLSIGRGAALIVSGNQVVYTFGQAEAGLFALGGGKIYGIGNVVFALVAFTLVLHFLLRKTQWGRYVHAIGGNERAARLTGIPVKVVKMSVYMFAGLMAGVTSVFLVGWLGSVTNALGQGDELRVIASTVIGGASLAGGYGSAYGAVIGALLIEVIRNALLLAGVNPFWQGIFVGCCILLAVLLQRIQVREEE